MSGTNAVPRVASTPLVVVVAVSVVALENRIHHGDDSGGTPICFTAEIRRLARVVLSITQKRNIYEYIYITRSMANKSIVKPISSNKVG